ncbi:MAG: thioredoxin-dependent thiol peroxidase [Sulfurospirillaceae bacterium]|nr:thioredoxin-dependent thiol peroxidase [Sulfurospirillaceae bacterium]MDD2825488.1 thioredoxin-dependent thiol peroxidase [Sulfurospirillaceae bacterium]
MLKIGDKAPAFSLPNQDDVEISLRDLEGKWIVLYFYPKDNTPGCTTEACDFTASLPQFEAQGAVILGISPDSTKKHRSFIEKQKLDITLLADESTEVAQSYGVWQLKKFCGKEYMGIVRSTFLINPEGKIAHIWSSVKVAGHANAVKIQLEALQK